MKTSKTENQFARKTGIKIPNTMWCVCARTCMWCFSYSRLLTL